MAEHEIAKGAWAGRRIRVVEYDERGNGIPEHQPDGKGGRWERLPVRELAKAYPAGEGPWPWLVEHKVRRPTPSGRSGTTISDAERRATGKRKLAVWLTKEEDEALKKLANGRSDRDTVGALLLAAAARK